MSAQEIVIELPGQKIAAKIWHEGKGLPILALHGWLDNAASFDALAPLISQHIVAIDLPGHGHSSHKAQGSVLHFIDNVIDCIRLANFLGWERFVLLGHSMGAAIASIIAGAVPHRIIGTALIDGLGPFTLPASQTPFQLRLFLNEMDAKKNKKSPHYDSFEEALSARLNVNKINKEAAIPLIKRALKQMENGKWRWRTDPRLLQPNALLLTEEQTTGFLQEVSSPLCLIRPEPGYPFSAAMMQQRLDALKDHPQMTLYRITGDHHIHLDSPHTVAKILNPFFESLT